MQLDGISLSVSCYNDGNLLFHFLASFALQEVPEVPIELLVINNRSTDNTKEVYQHYVSIFKDKGIIYRYIYEEEPGLNYARNRAMKEANFSYLAYTDADAKFPPKFLKYLKSIIEKSGLPMILCGPYDPWYDVQKPSWFLDGFNQMSYGNEEGFLNENETPHGINMIFRKKELLEMGGFSNQIQFTRKSAARGDETELFYRYWEKYGKRIIYYSPNLKVFHYTRPEDMSINYSIKRAIGLANTRAKMAEKENKLIVLKSTMVILGRIIKDVFSLKIFNKNWRYQYIYSKFSIHFQELYFFYKLIRLRKF